MTDLLHAEKLKTADALIHACLCVSSLQKALPTCKTPTERRRVTRALNRYKRDVMRLGERVLQLEATVRLSNSNLLS